MVSVPSPRSNSTSFPELCQNKEIITEKLLSFNGLARPTGFVKIKFCTEIVCFVVPRYLCFTSNHSLLQQVSVLSFESFLSG